MSWRYFMVLVNNLSPYGAVAMQTSVAEKRHNLDEDPENDKAAADAFFASVISV